MSEGIEDLLLEIRKKIEKQKKEILEDAQKEAERIIERARKKAENEINKIVASETLKVSRKVLSKALIKVRGRILDAKDAKLKKIEERVEQLVRNIASGINKKYDYHKTLVCFIKEATIAIGEGNLIISANKRDLQYLKKNIKNIEKDLEKQLNRPVSLSLSEKPADIIGGVIVENVDKNKVFYGTLEGRIRHVLEKNRIKINKILFSKVSEMMKGLL
ncbi:MAG: V-type ATP synthase subunit E [Candidatus Njordarchaeales archaeon]